MNKPNIIPLLLLFSGLLNMNVHCERDKGEDNPVILPQDTALPPITNIGANTFGCTVNGKNWVALTDYSFPKLMVSNVKEYKSFQIVASIKKKGQDNDQALELFVYKIGGNGIYSIGHSLDTTNNGHIFYSPPDAFGYTYQTDSNHTGQVEILRIDTVARIISGKFEADLAYYDTTISDSIIHIRNGRFDVKY